MDRAKLKEELFGDEGYVKHVYKDGLGYDTIGIGRLVDKRKNAGISKDEAFYLLNNDIIAKEAELDKVFSWWRRLTDNRQRAVCNMAFQLGIAGLQGFKNSMRLLELGRYDDAVVEFKKSLWYKQTPKRADRVLQMIKVG